MRLHEIDSEAKGTKMRQFVLKANALYLGVASVSAFIFDVVGIFLGVGPQSRILVSAPYAGIGFLEAHGLALILSVLLWRNAPSRMWHLTALAIEVLLGTANIVLWEIFIAAEALVVGYVTTALHWIFAMLQLLAAVSSSEDDQRYKQLDVGPAMNLKQPGF
jgi:hypothetical protein